MLNFLDKPIEINGERVLILRDEVSPRRPDRGVLIDDKLLGEGNALWMSGDAMGDAVTKHGELPVYGLWQTLVSSGLVDEEYDVQVLETSEAGDGYYLLKIGGNWRVGIIFQGDLQDLPDEALRALDEDAFKINYLDIELEQLTLPVNRVLSAKEQAELEARRSRQFNWRLAAVFSFTFMCVYALHLYLEYKYEVEKMEYKILQDEANSLRGNRDLLKLSRLLHAPDQRHYAKSLWLLVDALPPGAVQSDPVYVDGGVDTVKILPEYVENAFTLSADKFDVQIQSDGSALVTWKPVDSEVAQ